MIIGISGKINSGKDTVGKMIQYLTHTTVKEHNLTYEEFINLDFEEDAFDWKIKKFADKLKDIVCLLIGCTREQLEDREFKESPLSEEWQTNYYSKVTMQQSAPIEECLKEENQLMTPRLFMQLLGTEAGRQILHPNIWVNALMNSYDKRVGNSTYCTYCYGENYVIGDVPSWKCPKHPNMPTSYIPPASKPNWIITDCRFPNELKAIKDRKGITIRVNRTEYKGIRMHYKDGSSEDFPVKEHESETALDNSEFDYIINNFKGIEELINKVRTILTNEKLL